MVKRDLSSDQPPRPHPTAAAAPPQGALSGLLQRVGQLAGAHRAGPRPDAAAGDAADIARDINPAAQMQRLAAVVREAVDQGERAARYHQGASRHIDAALYELEQLRDDLEAVLQRRPEAAPAPAPAPMAASTVSSPAASLGAARPQSPCAPEGTSTTAVPGEKARSAA